MPATQTADPEVLHRPGGETVPDQAVGAAGAVRTDDDLIEEDLLVEEVSIDGMCGVY